MVVTMRSGQLHSHAWSLWWSGWQSTQGRWMSRAWAVWRRFRNGGFLTPTLDCLSSPTKLIVLCMYTSTWSRWAQWGEWGVFGVSMPPNLRITEYSTIQYLQSYPCNAHWSTPQHPQYAGLGQAIQSVIISSLGHACVQLFGKQATLYFALYLRVPCSKVQGPPWQSLSLRMELCQLFLEGKAPVSFADHLPYVCIFTIILRGKAYCLLSAVYEQIGNKQYHFCKCVVFD